MILEKEEILEFQKIYKEEFNEEISIEEAEKQSKEFLEFMVLFFKPKNIIKY